MKFIFVLLPGLSFSLQYILGNSAQILHQEVLNAVPSSSSLRVIFDDSTHILKGRYIKCKKISFCFNLLSDFTFRWSVSNTE